MQPTARGKSRPRLLYWFHTPPNVRVGRTAFDPEVRRALEAQNPDVAFDWTAIVETPIPPADTERWRERRRVERAMRAASDDETDEAAEPEAPSEPGRRVEPVLPCRSSKRYVTRSRKSSVVPAEPESNTTGDPAHVVQCVIARAGFGGGCTRPPPQAATPRAAETTTGPRSRVAGSRFRGPHSGSPGGQRPDGERCRRAGRGAGTLSLEPGTWNLGTVSSRGII